MNDFLAFPLPPFPSLLAQTKNPSSGGFFLDEIANPPPSPSLSLPNDAETSPPSPSDAILGQPTTQGLGRPTHGDQVEWLDAYYLIPLILIPLLALALWRWRKGLQQENKRMRSTPPRTLKLAEPTDHQSTIETLTQRLLQAGKMQKRAAALLIERGEQIESLSLQLAKQQDHSKDLGQHLATAAEHHQQLKASHDEWKNRFDGVLDESEQLQQSVRSLESSLQELREENEKLNGTLREAASDATRHRREQDQALETLRQFEAHQESTQQRITLLERQVIRARESMGNTETTAKAFKTELQTVQKEILQSRQALEIATSGTTRLAEDRDKAIRIASDLKKELKVLRQLRDETHQLTESLQQKNQLATHEKRELSNHISIQQETMEAHRKRCQQVESQLTLIDVELTEAKRKLAQSDAKRLELNELVKSDNQVTKKSKKSLKGKKEKTKRKEKVKSKAKAKQKDKKKKKK